MLGATDEQLYTTTTKCAARPKFRAYTSEMIMSQHESFRDAGRATQGGTHMVESKPREVHSDDGKRYELQFVHNANYDMYRSV